MSSRPTPVWLISGFAALNAMAYVAIVALFEAGYGHEHGVTLNWQFIPLIAWVGVLLFFSYSVWRGKAIAPWLCGALLVWYLWRVYLDYGVPPRMWLTGLLPATYAVIYALSLVYLIRTR